MYLLLAYRELLGGLPVKPAGHVAFIGTVKNRRTYWARQARTACLLKSSPDPCPNLTFHGAEADPFHLPLPAVLPLALTLRRGYLDLGPDKSQ